MASNRTIAQENENSNALLSERFLNAVEKSDLTAIKSILSSDLGRSLARLPIGLTAAGYAVESGHYKIAHYILAVRHQQMRFTQKKNSKMEKKGNQKVKGGFLNPKPKLPTNKRQNPSPNILNIKSEYPLKKKIRLIDNPIEASRMLPSTPPDTSEGSNQANPFDPLKTPSAALPAVK